jgi:hypothetical protein
LSELDFVGERVCGDLPCHGLILPLSLFFIFVFCIGRTGNDTQTAADRFVYVDRREDCIWGRADR